MTVRWPRGISTWRPLSPNGTAAHPDVWEKVYRRMNARQMPPAGKERPSEPEYVSTLALLAAALDGDAAAHPNPGRTETIRRLNRTEYQNAIRDLLALDIDAAALLPADEASHGFDNVTVGDLSPTLLDRYISAAQKISRLAVGGAPRVAGRRHDPRRPDLTQEEHVEGLPLGTRGGALIPLHVSAGWRVRDPDPARRATATRRSRGCAEPHELEVLLDREQREVVHREAARRRRGHRARRCALEGARCR